MTERLQRLKAALTRTDQVRSELLAEIRAEEDASGEAEARQRRAAIYVINGGGIWTGIAACGTWIWRKTRRKQRPAVTLVAATFAAAGAWAATAAIVGLVSGSEREPAPAPPAATAPNAPGPSTSPKRTTPHGAPPPDAAPPPGPSAEPRPTPSPTGPAGAVVRQPARQPPWPGVEDVLPELPTPTPPKVAPRPAVPPTEVDVDQPLCLKVKVGDIWVILDLDLQHSCRK